MFIYVVVVVRKPINPTNEIDMCCPLSCARHDTGIKSNAANSSGIDIIEPGGAQYIHHIFSRWIQMNVHEENIKIVLTPPQFFSRCFQHVGSFLSGTSMNHGMALSHNKLKIVAQYPVWDSHTSDLLRRAKLAVGTLFHSSNTVDIFSVEPTAKIWLVNAN